VGIFLALGAKRLRDKLVRHDTTVSKIKKRRKKMNLEVDFAGIKMKNPVTVASRNVWIWI